MRMAREGASQVLLVGMEPEPAVAPTVQRAVAEIITDFPAPHTAKVTQAPKILQASTTLSSKEMMSKWRPLRNKRVAWALVWISPKLHVLEAWL